jgi:Ca-activated chloride channel family protein
LLWRYRKFDRKQRADLAKFASDSLIAQLTRSVSILRRNLKRGLVVGGVALLAVALARPLVGFRWEEAKRKGLDLLIAVDTSKSMLAQDVKPDRLTRAKMAVEDLLQKLEGDRVGLIAFAGNAFLQCPLTLDYDAFRQSLEALDTSIIPRGGTDIAAAIHEAEAALENNGNNERLLVLLTDGEDLEGKALEAARDAAKNGLKVFTVGVGSASGELIPAPDGKGGTQFVKDASGQFAKSKLDESMLKQIAEAAGGIYQPLGQQAQGLETLYRDGLSKFTKHDITSRMRKVYLERFQWPLAFGLLCLVLEPLIGIRKRRATAERDVSSAPRTATGKSAVKVAAFNRARPSAPWAAAAALAFLALPSFAHASAGGAEKAYAKGEFEKAAQEYQRAAEKDPKKPELQFNHGAAAYKAGQHETAAEAFARAMKTDNVPLQQDNYYNLGNTQYRLGQKTEKSNPQETIKSWEAAVKSYEAALQLKTDDTDAKYNRDLVKKKLEELKKQQEQQKQDQQNQQSQQDQDNKRDQDQKQDQKDRQNSGSGQDKPDQKDQGKDEQKQNGASGDPEKKDQKEQKDQGKGQDKNDQQKGQDRAKGDKPEQKTPDQKEQQQAKSGKPGDEKKASEKDLKPEAGKEQKNPAAQTQDKSEPKKDRANQKPELANKNAKSGEKKDQGEDEAEAQRVPGKMTKEEAKQLLDSLKNGDRRMPVAPAARGQAGGHDDEPIKDW